MKSRKYPNLSFCVPVYNEEKHLISGLNKITSGLKKVVGDNSFEIIVVDNGSTDNTPQLIKNIQNKRVRPFTTLNKGMGLAYRKAIKESKNEHVVLSAIDLPFGFSDLKNASKIWGNYDLIYGSKAHPKSQISTSLKRNISSYVYRFLLKLLFNINVKDSQGSVFFKKSKIKPIIKHCDSDNAFFTAQLAIYGDLNGLKMAEVPVNMGKLKNRKSKYNVVKDGKTMLMSAIKERFLLSQNNWRDQQ